MRAQGASQVGIWNQSVPGKREASAKAGMCLVYLRENKEAEMTAVQWAEGRILRDWVRMVRWRPSYKGL